MDFNDARLHEATVNLETDELIFSRLSIALADGKQNLILVVFSALVGFVLKCRFILKLSLNLIEQYVTKDVKIHENLGQD